MLATYRDLRAEHTAWVQRIHAVLFHLGAPALGEGTLRSEQCRVGVVAELLGHLADATAGAAARGTAMGLSQPT